jgi:methyl-accepting chemotaxis protein
MGAIVEVVATIRGGADQISGAIDELSTRTEGQATNLEQTAAAVDQITGTVKKTAQVVGAAHKVVSAAKGDAERSGEIVRQAIAAMGGIEQSSKHIVRIIGVIDEIAFQTNLLALNAGVEAARAGDAGRGFAVVASEVRALAQRSAEAAKEIKGLISSSATQVGLGVDLVGQTGKALERIVAQVVEIDNVVSAIAASAEEQANALQQVDRAVSQMDQTTQHNAEMAQQTTAAARALAAQANELDRLTGRFSIARAGARREPPRARAARVAAE